MDRNYSGGWFHSEQVSRKVKHYEHSDTISISNSMLAGLVKSFKRHSEKHITSLNTAVNIGASLHKAYDHPFLCRMCQNLFTINKSYGKHECFSHYGYRDLSNPKGPTWSCCGKKLSERGCMSCDHLATSSVTKYTTPTPSMEINLAGALYNLYTCLPLSEKPGPHDDIGTKGNKIFFLRRFLDNEALKTLMRAHPKFLRLSMQYLTQEVYDTMFITGGGGGGVSTDVQSCYIPVYLKKRDAAIVLPSFGVRIQPSTAQRAGVTKKKREKKKKKKSKKNNPDYMTIYLNIFESRLSVPLSRPSWFVKS